MNWCDGAIGKKPQREPHLQNVIISLKGQLLDYWFSDRRDINATDVEKQITSVISE